MLFPLATDNYRILLYSAYSSHGSIVLLHSWRGVPTASTAQNTYSSLILNPRFSTPPPPVTTLPQNSHRRIGGKTAIVASPLPAALEASTASKSNRARPVFLQILCRLAETLVAHRSNTALPAQRCSWLFPLHRVKELLSHDAPLQTSFKCII